MHITDLTSLLPVHAARRYSQRALSRIDSVLIHHTAAVPDKRRDWAAELARHARHHVMRHGWPGLAYHYAVAPDGQVFKCNPLSRISYHCPGWNTRALGVVLLGDFTRSSPSPAALASCGDLLRELHRGLPGLRLLRAHRDCRATACPGAAFADALLDKLAWPAGLQRGS